MKIADSTSIPDPSSITSWPAAIVAVTIIVAILVVPSVLTYLGNRQTKLALSAAKDSRDAAQAGQQAAQTVEATLTTTNGGSHIKDQLNRIEATQADNTEAVDEVRKSQASMARSLGELQSDMVKVKDSAAKHHPEG